jgi:hypothetical protein
MDLYQVILVSYIVFLSPLPTFLSLSCAKVSSRTPIPSLRIFLLVYVKDFHFREKDCLFIIFKSIHKPIILKFNYFYNILICKEDYQYFFHKFFHKILMVLNLHI